MRLALTGGGTGGHILPALTVLEAVRLGAASAPEVRFFGPENRGERKTVENAGLTFESVPAAPIRGRNPFQLARSVWQLAVGIVTAARKMRTFRPDVVFSTGGYGSFPGCVAARLLRTPLVVYLPDVEPGWAVKAEKRLATRLTTTTEAALEFLPRAKTIVTGYPVRRAFFATTREDARRTLGIATDERVVVVAGATQGAHAINMAVFNGLPTLLDSCTVVHVTGPADYGTATGFKAALGSPLTDRYDISPFRDDLATVMLAADLAVMRAGASVLGELPAAALPAVLVPAAYAGGHQRHNAAWLADAGAALVLGEDRLGELTNLVLALIGDPQRLATMREAAAALARPGAADAIAKVIEEVAKR
ncbi:MAG: UDP-N-acetylglucosamine--N-acetylmuramyl-(pentapeptide) pyrophosphoryl-undecaprenol N-acetylglucosamine transferase [Anaerolineaceae bacterium]